MNKTGQYYCETCGTTFSVTPGFPKLYCPMCERVVVQRTSTPPIEDEYEVVAELLREILNWAVANRGTKHAFMSCYTHKTGHFPPWVKKAEAMLDALDPQPVSEIDKLEGFLRETWDAHRDHEDPEYNCCEAAECAWCQGTREEIARLRTLLEDR